MPELLLELFSEEIPARMQARAAADLERAVNERLLAAGFLPEGVKAFATPRRLALVAAGLPVRQPDRKEEKKGPRVGAPAAAIEGFLKAAGLSSIEAAEIRDDKKGAFYVATLDQKGREAAALIAEMMPELIASFPWPKSMRWGAGDLRWVRPLKRVLCVFDGEPVKFSVGGLTAGDESEGHRFLAPGAIRVRSYEAYAAALARAFVMLDGATRAEAILAEACTLCSAQGLDLVEDKALLAEVAGLVEWPVPLIGAFDEKFLDLPDEVLTATMKGHQKYFSVRDPKTGRLANRFIAVANIEAKDGGAAMRAGYERVLTARLSDAWYLYHQDLKRPLGERVGDLDRVTFFEGLGSIGDKARRVEALADHIARAIDADWERAGEAARLAKADLTTGMVYEFPELQGVMGRYYALKQGVDASVADAIRDHYRPLGQDDDPPTAPVSVAVALADKLDTLAAFWAMRKKPTGSGDPFALRRAALGVISLLSVASARLRLRAFPSPLAFDRDDLLAFFHDRLKVYLRDKGRRHDRIEAVLLRADGSPEDDLVLIMTKLDALDAFLKSEDGANLAAGFKRAVNILKAQAETGGAPAFNSALLQQAEERALHGALLSAEQESRAALAREDFAGAMRALAALRAPIDAFFDKVTVNADDPGLRANRIALLQRFRAAAAEVADFSKLEG